MKWLPALLLIGCSANTAGTLQRAQEPDSGVDSSADGIELDDFEPRRSPSSNNDRDAATDAMLPLQDGAVGTADDAGAPGTSADAGPPWPYAMICEPCWSGEDSECGAGHVCYSGTCYMLNVGDVCLDGFDRFGLHPYGLYVDKDTTHQVCSPTDCDAWNEKYIELKN